MPITIDPIRYLETRSGIVTVTSTFFVSVVANNQAIIPTASVTGKRVRVMGWIAQSVGAVVGSFTLKSASGGTALMAPLTVPPVTAGLSDKLPIIETGYMETNTGEGLYVDVTGAGVNFTIFNIIYTP